jgi:hypothetical protein
VAPGDLLRDLDPARARHPQVEQRDPRPQALDLRQRLVAVRRAPGDADSLALEVVGDGFQDRGVVVGDETGDGGVHFGGFRRPSAPGDPRNG